MLRRMLPVALPAVALACAALAADISGSWEFTGETFQGSVRRRLSLSRKFEFKQKGESSAEHTRGGSALRSCPER